MDAPDELAAERGVTAVPLIGRDDDLALVRSVADGSARDGVLVLSGDPGVGKTALLDAAVERAEAAGTRVLRATGVQFDPAVTLSGLDQVLTPLHREVDRLPPCHRSAVTVALGLGEGPAPGRLLLCNAALALLRLGADVGPLLVIVDDAQQLDETSAHVLAFAGRRLAGSPVRMIAALRSGSDSVLGRAGLPEHRLHPLDATSASRLLTLRFPVLAPEVHGRLLAEADGNPLALLELPTVLTDLQRAGLESLPPVLPLSDRLHALFETRLLQLPAGTRELLLLGALQGTGDLVLLEAAGRPSGGLELLVPAERSGLISTQGATPYLRFSQPLVRSAVVAMSTAIERRRAHRALAAALVGQPDRRAWHLAEATVGPDEEVALLLEDGARASLRRGDAVGAVAAVVRAADLSPEPAHRDRRRAAAAYLGADVTGELHNASRILGLHRHAGHPGTDSLQEAVAASSLLLNDDGDVDTAHTRLSAAIARHAGRGRDVDGTVAEALHTLMLVCFFGGRAELWQPFHAAVDRLRPAVPITLLLCGATMADPARTAASALRPLAAAARELSEVVDPTRIVRTGMAAFYVDRLRDCREALWRVVEDGRHGGAIASAIDALLLLCFDDLTTGRWDEAGSLADEGIRLGDAHGYRLLTWPGRLAQALLAAGRGDTATVQAVTEEMLGWAAPRGVGTVQVYAWHARALAALGRGDDEEAYRHASDISPAGRLESHVAHALWVLLDLVEAAVRTGRRAEAQAHVAAMRRAGLGRLSSRLALVTAGSAAMAAKDRDAGVLFERALAVPGAGRWPFELARIQLAHGEHLRRHRAIPEAQTQLRRALQLFRGVGAGPWAARVADQLRATGPNGRDAEPLGAVALTSQEAEIAALAASGLTNKQIGDRLHLSHRTVGAHLYRVFPKLGIRSRAALRDALAAAASPQRPGRSSC